MSRCALVRCRAHAHVSAHCPRDTGTGCIKRYLHYSPNNVKVGEVWRGDQDGIHLEDLVLHVIEEHVNAIELLHGRVRDGEQQGSLMQHFPGRVDDRDHPARHGLERHRTCAQQRRAAPERTIVALYLTDRAASGSSRMLRMCSSPIQPTPTIANLTCADPLFGGVSAACAIVTFFFKKQLWYLHPQSFYLLAIERECQLNGLLNKCRSTSKISHELHRD
jgi:hypothetical protein